MLGETVDGMVPLRGCACKVVSCSAQRPGFKLISCFASNATAANKPGFFENTQMPAHALTGKRKAFGEFRYRAVGPVLELGDDHQARVITKGGKDSRHL